MHSSLKRGQAATETMLLVAVVVSIILLFLLGGFREWELSIGTGAARQGALEFQASHPEHRLTRLLTTDTQNQTIVQAMFVPAVTSSIEESALKTAMIGKIRASLAPQASIQNNCVKTLLRTYCA